jgi:hypothetical protein
MPIIPGTWEAETGELQVWDPPTQIGRTISETKQKQKAEDIAQEVEPYPAGQSPGFNP